MKYKFTKKIGDQHGVKNIPLPKAIADALEFKKGMEVELEVKKEKIIITKKGK